jgi:Ni/Fe-hydrogenase subunit HybB-like protein
MPPALTAAAPPTRLTLDTIAGHIPLARSGWGRWWLAMALALALCGLLVVTLGLLFWQGVGIWGNNIPVTWALDIVSYDWWIGIACGGLLVSSVFLLLDVEWRGAINRIAETMSLLAAAAAAVYPIIHLGRPWFFYWNLPYANTFALWPQFRSPLYWDAIDILAFLGLAGTFWYTGLIPDLASLRDQACTRIENNKGRLPSFTA